MRRSIVGMGICAALMVSAPFVWGQSTGPSLIDTLHRSLNLSPQQEPAWQSYRAQVLAPAKAQDRRRAASQMFPSLTATQRMDLVEAEMKQELLDLQQQSQALKAFYATLSPAQKSTFDAQTLPPQDSRQQNQSGQ